MQRKKGEAILGHFWFFISNDSIFQGLSNDASISRIWRLVKFSLAILNLGKSRELKIVGKQPAALWKKAVRFHPVPPSSSLVIGAKEKKGEMNCRSQDGKFWRILS